MQPDSASSDLEVFHFEDDRPSFEDLGHDDDVRFWYARDLMAMLGYESYSSFQNALNKAIGTCTTLGIPVLENFAQVQREIDQQTVQDCKLSRFACYLTSMNGDVRKPQVAAAQVYFANTAEAVRTYIQNADNVERVQIRDDISERERSLSGVARQAGVQQYPLFQNAGYRGMYNMDMRRLKQVKGVDQNRSLLDFMGKEELAANLFRLTQTEAKIKKDNVKGQWQLENVAEQVGRRVRATIIETGGTPPERLSVAPDIKKVGSGLKKTNREFSKMDRAKQIPE